MLKTLLKAKLSGFFAQMTQGSKKKKSKVATILLGVLFVVLVLYMLGAMSVLFFGLCLMGKETGETSSIFTLASMIASAFCIFGSIFATKTQIFDSKDNELLLSMPIPVRYIFLSRMITLLLINYLLESLFMLPCIVVYGIVCGYSILGFINMLLVFILIPFLTLSISSLIGWVVSIISAHMKNKSIVSSVLFTLIFVAYMYVCFNIGAFFGEGEEVNVDFGWTNRVPLFKWCGDAVANDNIVSALLFALISILSGVLTFLVLNLTFTKIITTKKTGAKIKYDGRVGEGGSQFMALVKKEIKRFFSSSAYLMNAGMGSIMQLVISILIVTSIDYDMLLDTFKQMDPVLFTDELIQSLITFIVAALGLFFSSMNIVSTPSISLEDRCLWILQSAPIDPRRILKAKLLTHIIVCAPFSIISTLILSIALHVSVINTILLVIISLSGTFFTAYFGLLLGLKFPKFGWQNENIAVKQGFAVFGTMLGSMLYMGVLCVIGFILAMLNIYLSLLVMLLPSVAIVLILHYYFTHKGAVAFAALKH